jgi:hypothetical protein
LCYRGWSSWGLDDEQPISGFSVVGIEAERLAKEDGSGFVLVAASSELAEQAIRDPERWIETDDLAQVGRSERVATQRDLRACTEQAQRDRARVAAETRATTPGK